MERLPEFNNQNRTHSLTDRKRASRMPDHSAKKAILLLHLIKFSMRLEGFVSTKLTDSHPCLRDG